MTVQRFFAEIAGMVCGTGCPDPRDQLVSVAFASCVEVNFRFRTGLPQQASVGEPNLPQIMKDADLTLAEMTKILERAGASAATRLLGDQYMRFVSALVSVTQRPAAPTT